MPQLPMKDISPGAVIVDYGVGSGFENLEISPVLGTINWTSDDQVADVFEEGYGDAPVDSVFKGTISELEVPMVRFTLLTMSKLFPNISTLVGDVLTFKSPVGHAMRENAVAVCIKPLINNVVSVEETEWTLLYLCHPMKAWAVGWDRDGQRIFLVRFKVFPKQAGTAGDLFQLGVKE